MIFLNDNYFLDDGLIGRIVYFVALYILVMKTYIFEIKHSWNWKNNHLAEIKMQIIL